MAQRLPDWIDRLSALVNERRAARFEWGATDCALWPADAVLALTGIDPAAELRGTYRTAGEARALLRRLGGLAVPLSWGGTEINPLFAAIGDVGIVRTETKRRCGAVCAGGLWLVASTSGLGPVEFKSALKAWKVGDA